MIYGRGIRLELGVGKKDVTKWRPRQVGVEARFSCCGGLRGARGCMTMACKTHPVQSGTAFCSTERSS